jgi:AcrR family transcriptional regulator
MSIKRDQILRCACDLYLAEGLEGFSMRKLAKCVGCTAPALYRHYGSKDDVLHEVVGEAYRLFAQYLYRALEERTPLERFLKAGESYLDFALEQPALYEVIYAQPELLGVRRDEGSVADQLCAIGQFWADRVREVMGAGLLKKGDPDAISTTLWGHGHGLISIYHRGLLPAATEKEFRTLVRESFRRIVAGLGTEAFQEQAAHLRRQGNTGVLTT